MAIDLRGKPLPQRWMIGAIALSFVSQFLLYMNDDGVAGLYDMTNTDYYTQMVVYAFASHGTGWQLHPQAFVLLPVLAFLFLREDFVARPQVCDAIADRLHRSREIAAREPGLRPA